MPLLTSAEGLSPFPETLDLAEGRSGSLRTRGVLAVSGVRMCPPAPDRPFLEQPRATERPWLGRAGRSIAFARAERRAELRPRLPPSRLCWGRWARGPEQRALWTTWENKGLVGRKATLICEPTTQVFDAPGRVLWDGERPQHKTLWVQRCAGCGSASGVRWTTWP